MMKKSKESNSFWTKVKYRLSTTEMVMAMVIATLFVVGAAFILAYQAQINVMLENMTELSPVAKMMLSHAGLSYLVVGSGIMAVIVSGSIRHRTRIQLECVGLTNHAGISPALWWKHPDRQNPRLMIWEFWNPSIPVEEWEKKRSALETALGVTIVKLEYTGGKRRIRLLTAPAKDDLPSVVRWKENYLSHKNFELVLGEGYKGPVSVNLNRIPHFLLGGSTGSGKSVLLKSLLMQAYKKGAVIYVADFKGGIDYPTIWHEKCRMCTDERSLLYYLEQLTTVLKSRKMQFAETGCPNLDAYNDATGENMPHLIFGCDEVAELLDKTGADSERKKLIAQIENKLATIARQGRAFGIHLILATQRPDANIISGQIKNNMDLRICGRADNVLSQIILDSTIAADQIPKDTQGRFITGDGTVFQGYFFDESKL